MLTTVELSRAKLSFVSAISYTKLFCLLTSKAYFRPESVAQAIYMLDETDFHTSGSGSMRVQEADMSFKRQKEVPTGPDAAKARGKRRDVEKIKEITKMQNAQVNSAL